MTTAMTATAIPHDFELDVSMALTGVSRLGDVDHNVLW